ncbi:MULTISPECIES: superoxide dismutase family protein [Halomonadaceae]|uniref:superoxide dismutase family protein n=1 Tax=Halomonadaceae TaxID=28256 RepID=UPI0015997965|nr:MULTISPECIES: superoxide dismutase family protein [Halomonas]QJQ96818.1 superoxide dismutase [Halomonas sp. PA5]
MKRNAITLGVAAATTLLLAGAVQAEQEANDQSEQNGQHEEYYLVDIHWIEEEGIGEQIGTMRVEDSEHGLLLTPDLSDMPPGIYGFHVHENPSCEAGEDDDDDMMAGQQAGSHYDPEDTGSHQGPYGEGHLGDLPVLAVNEEGEANIPVLAPRLSLSDLDERSLMIHEGGDTYADEPTDGGGGGRMACGIVIFQ